MRLESYLEFGGVELSNPNRTYSYVDAFGDPRFSVHLDDCLCEALDTGPFMSPSSDPAPWYDGTQESEEFFGLVLEPRLAPPAVRPSARRATGGATVGPLVRNPRIFQVGGLMFASTHAGMSYGE